MYTFYITPFYKAGARIKSPCGKVKFASFKFSRNKNNHEIRAKNKKND